MALLELRHVSKRFGPIEAVRDVSLNIEAGEFFTLLGPSGCGKTTVLRMIAGFDEPDSGTLFLDGRPLAGIPPEARPVHTVFQSFALFPHLSVWNNIAFPLEMVGLSGEALRRRVNEALAMVHLEDKGQAYPQELSGGQKQRVALARALVNRPRVLLLDEALGALDAKLRELMQVELIGLQRQLGITFVFVTHDQQEALALSHRVAVMNRGQLEQVDTPEALYSAPKNRFVADFIGTINLIDAKVQASNHHALELMAHDLGNITAPSHPEVAAGTQGTLAIRPEQIRLFHLSAQATLKNHFAGTVREYLYLGDVTIYKVQLDNGLTLEAQITNTTPGLVHFHEVGDRVGVEWRHDAGVYLSA